MHVARFARLSLRLSVSVVVCVKYVETLTGVAPWSLDSISLVTIGQSKGARRCFKKIFAQELNRIMAWWQLMRFLLSFFSVNPGK